MQEFLKRKRWEQAKQALMRGDLKEFLLLGGYESTTFALRSDERYGGSLLCVGDREVAA